MFSNFIFFVFLFTMDSFVLTPRWIKGFAVFLAFANTLSALMNDTFVNVYVAEETQICLFNIKYFASRQILASAHYNILLFEIYMFLPLRYPGALMSTQLRMTLETTYPDPPHNSSLSNLNPSLPNDTTIITIPSSSNSTNNNIAISPTTSTALLFSPLSRLTSDEQSRPPVRLLEERGRANEEIDSKTERHDHAPLLLTDSSRDNSQFLSSPRRVSLSLDNSLQPLTSNNNDSGA